MNEKRRPERRAKQSPKPAGREQDLAIRRAQGGNAWELVYPPSVLRRQEDMEEVEAMLAAGEIDIAMDELRWLLSGCRALLQAHQLLGEIGLSDNDLPLAKAHLGYAFDMGIAAIRKEKDFAGPLPYALPANQPFFEAGKGLAWCFFQQGDIKAAERVVRELLALDPSDPLQLGELQKSFHRPPNAG